MVYTAVNIHGCMFIQVFKHPGPRLNSMKCFAAGLLEHLKASRSLGPGNKLYLFADCHRSHRQKDMDKLFYRRIEFRV